MSFIKEFKDFAVKGNVADMAVGIIIGASFGKIVSSLVADVIMPPLGLLLGGIDFKGFEVVIKEAVGTAPAVSLRYGMFLQTVFDFLIQAFAIFMVIKGLNSLKKAKENTPPPAPPAQEVLLKEIRDILKTK